MLWIYLGILCFCKRGVERGFGSDFLMNDERWICLKICILCSEKKKKNEDEGGINKSVLLFLVATHAKRCAMART